MSFSLLRMLIDQENCFSSWKHAGKLGNIVSATKMFLNLLGNIFASREANFVSAPCFPGWANWETWTGSKMFPQQCFLVCPGLKVLKFRTKVLNYQTTVARLLHFWSQTFNNALCFSLYLPFVFIVFVATLMTIWLQKCGNLATVVW